MYMRCVCGKLLTDNYSPNDIEHLLISYTAMEKLQDLVDEEVAAQGEEQLWPEHWRESGAKVVWKCDNCQRLLVGARDNPADIVIYNIERVGL